MRPRLQPRASEAATPCVGGCNPVPMPMCRRPVEAFWAMVRDEESDRLVEAFAQMEAVSGTHRLRLPLG